MDCDDTLLLILSYVNTKETLQSILINSRCNSIVKSLPLWNLRIGKYLQSRDAIHISKDWTCKHYVLLEEDIVEYGIHCALSINKVPFTSKYDRIPYNFLNTHDAIKTGRVDLFNYYSYAVGHWNFHVPPDIMMDIISNNKIDMVKHLASIGIDLMYRKGLIEAIRKGHCEMVSFLIDRGIELYKTDMCTALESGNMDMITYMYDQLTLKCGIIYLTNKHLNALNQVRNIEVYNWLKSCKTSSIDMTKLEKRYVYLLFNV